MPPGAYRVTAEKPGFRKYVLDEVPLSTQQKVSADIAMELGSVSENVQVTAGKTRTLSDRLFLSVDEGSLAFVRGSVFTESGLSVPNVRVEIARVTSENSIEKLDSRITGETGEFVFRLPPDVAKYRVTLKADGAKSNSRDVEIDGAAIYRVALTYKNKS